MSTTPTRFSTEQGFERLASRLRALNDPPPTIRVLIVDDHVLFAEATAIALGLDDRLEVVGSAGDGSEAIDLARALCPDVILMDLHMPFMDGLSATRVIRDTCPASRVVIVTASTSPFDVERAREAGAIGFVTKNASANELLNAVYEAAAPVVPLRAYEAAVG
ncbi:MAG: response regulator [Gaiellaceae bacterium]